MLKIIYSENGTPINDFYIEEEYERILDLLPFFEDEIGEVVYSSETIFNRIRLGVVMGEIFPKNIVFIYNEIVMKLNEYGAIDNWPNGFCDVNTNMSEKIMRAAMNLYEKNNSYKKD